jgi:hydrogenase maturation protease
MNILVFGIGQSLRGDDAAGLEAVRLWQGMHPESARRVRVELGELPGLGLLDRLEGMQAAILVDALHSTDKPGTILHLRPEELASFSTDTQSAHGWGVAETLALGLKLYPELAECRISLIGIVGRQFGMGMGLSAEVRAGLEAAAEQIEEEVQTFV